MNKIIAGSLLVIVVLLGYKQFSSQNLGSTARSTRCTASTTAWAVGPQEEKTVLAYNSARVAFSLTTTGANTTSLFRLDSTSPTVTNADIVTASSSRSFDENYAYNGVVKAGAVASTTLIVTECLAY